jgi:hypothetical protein
MNNTHVATRRAAMGLGFFGFLAVLGGCDSGVSQSEIESKSAEPPGKSEAEARKQAGVASGAPPKPKRP